MSEQQVDTGLGLMGVDWEERIDYARMRKERLEKAKQAVARSGADALFLFRWENVRYVTSLRTHMWPVMFWGLASAILPNGAEPQLYTMDVDHVKARMPWIKDTVKEFAGGGLEVFAGAKAWAEDAKQVLKDTKVEPKVIGVDAWNPPLLEALPKVFPNTRFVDGQKIILEARAVKTKDEINCLKNAMSLTVSGFGAGLEFLRPGRKECEVLAECFRAMYANGGEWTQCSNIVCSGPYLAPYRRFTSDRIIDHGDMVVFDIGSCFNGYWGDFTRTFICGKDAQPTKEQVKVHMNAYNAMLAAIKKIRPGGSTKEVYEAAEPWILGGLLGHGLGLGSAEPPFIVEQSKQEPMELKPGMVFSIEPYAGVPGVGGVRLEHNVLCTETGYEIIDKFPFEQRLME